MTAKDLRVTCDLLRQHQANTEHLPRVSLLAEADVRELAQTRLRRGLEGADLTAQLALARDIEQLVLLRQAHIQAKGGVALRDLPAMLKNPAVAYKACQVAPAEGTHG